MPFGEETGTITTVTDCASSILEVMDPTCAVVVVVVEEGEDTWVVEVVGMNLDEEGVAHRLKEQTTELWYQGCQLLAVGKISRIT